MTVGVLLMTHPGIGRALRETARAVLGAPALTVELFEVPFSAALDDLLMGARGMLDRLDSGDGVLVLTDLYGASPSNLAARLEACPVETRRVAGLNLPMLLRVLNYPEQNLDALAETAALGARNGVVTGHA